MMYFSQGVLQKFRMLVANEEPVSTTSRGKCFFDPTLPMAAIKLDVSFEEYFAFLETLDSAVRPRAARLQQVTNEPFDLIVAPPLCFENGVFTDDGRPVTLL